MLESERDIEFGKLFYNEEYIDDIRLITHAMADVFEALGHSFENPISLYWLCFEIGIPFGVLMRIQVEIIQHFNGVIADELRDLEQFKEVVIRHFPKAINLQDKSYVSLVKALANSLNPELKPLLEAIVSN